MSHLLHELEEGSAVLLPVLGQLLSFWVFHTAQLNGHFKAVCMQVIPVLHPPYKRNVKKVLTRSSEGNCTTALEKTCIR